MSALLHEATITGLGQAMAAGQTTAEELVLAYLARIAAHDKQGARLNAVLELNPDAVYIARRLDAERRQGRSRGPLHGIPVLLKDNINTADKLHTSAGSLALANSFAPQDAFLVQRLRRAGAVILGKANMTEFANWMTQGMPSGYSSRGGQVVNPYQPHKLTPGGSSSGSAVAVAANFCTVAVGTETSGSILSPAHHNAVVGIKPTVGLISRSGIVPIAYSQDTAGPLARSVEDAAILLGAMTGVDRADPATGGGPVPPEYTQCLRLGVKGMRVGVPRTYFDGKLGEAERALFEFVLATLRELGLEVVDPADVPTAANGVWPSSVFRHEFKAAMNHYLAALGPAAPVRSLAEIIAFNQARPEAALKYGQTHLVEAEATSGTLTEQEYLQDRLQDIRLAAGEGIDATLRQHNLDALLFAGANGAFLGARAGYPSVIVPAGITGSGQPLGLTFTGAAWQEPALLRLAYAYEQATRLRRPPALEP